MMKKSAWVLLRNGEKVLILKRGKSANNGGQWNFPGGTVEPKELPLLTAHRELKEEAGIIAKLYEVCAIHTDEGIFYYYAGVVRNGTVKINEESSAFKWVNLSDLIDKKLSFHKSISKFFNLPNERSIKVISSPIGASGLEEITLSDHRRNKKSFISFIYGETNITITALNTPIDKFFPLLAAYMSVIKKPNLIVSPTVLKEQKQEFLESWAKFVRTKGKNLNLPVKEVRK